MAPIPVAPRKLNNAERAVLDKILSTPFPGSPELKKQIDVCQVIAQWSEDSVSVDIHPMPEAVPAVGVANGPAPAIGVVQGLPGDELPLVGEILVWVAGGYISGIEFTWYGDEMPKQLPPADRILVEVE
ncbi:MULTISPECIES: hypothetical protein [unclassified Streptomyces]|uniref:hypothetical protein n=1 Tax=unclassified Streptomyces TaxID=2593676 RepID=UPI0033CC340C